MEVDEGAEFVGQRSRVADDGLHRVGVDGGSGIEGHRMVNDAIGCRVGVGILVPFIGLGKGSAAIGGE